MRVRRRKKISDWRPTGRQAPVTGCLRSLSVSPRKVNREPIPTSIHSTVCRCRGRSRARMNEWTDGRTDGLQLRAIDLSKFERIDRDFSGRLAGCLLLID